MSNIKKVQSYIEKEIDALHKRVEKCEEQTDKNSKEIQLLEKTVRSELSRCSVKLEEEIPYVFSPPRRNQYFSGRTEELENIKCMLDVGETLKEKKVRVAAVCGLGGIGKTSLASEYAHQMKDFYEGGVYWFSAENDVRLNNTMKDIADRIGASLGSFDLTWKNILKKIKTVDKPCLIVLDCLDEKELSQNMLNFFFFLSQETICGHLLVLTRRNPKLLVNEVSIFEEDFCFLMKCFQTEEAKQFLFLRTGAKRNEDNESIAGILCEELGELPLALEQAGAYIQMRSFPFSAYLKQYRAKRSKLLKKKKACARGEDSTDRLAVHTTWLINIEYMKKSDDGEVAVRFMNACSFFNGNEIQEQLINVGVPQVDDVKFCQCVSSPLGPYEVLNLLTDFSLFTCINTQSVSTNRLVQELIMENLDPQSKVKSFNDAVSMLSYAFSQCPAPSNEAISELRDSPSHFYMWSRYCEHGHHLRVVMEELLTNLGSVFLDSVWLPETAKILYECAVHLSANYNQEEAKRTLNFAYRVLDWIPEAQIVTIEKNISNSSLFPLPIPLPKSIQSVIKQRCFLPPLTDKPSSDASRGCLQEEIERGEESYSKGRYKKALEAYSSAIKLAQNCNTALNDLLLTKRAMVYIELKQYENAVKDTNDFIARRPNRWEGYATKALALVGFGETISAEITAALAFYHNRKIFSTFAPFKKSFSDLQKRIFLCDSVDDLREAIYSQVLQGDQKGLLKIIVLGSEEYTLNFGKFDKPWNDCILVGARKDSPVSLKSDSNVSLQKCMLTNISFYLYGALLRCLPGSSVKVHSCNFTGYDVKLPVVKTEGDFSAEHCKFTNRKNSGFVCHGKAFVHSCTFSGNMLSGLQVCDGGELLVSSSHICNNTNYGLLAGPKVSKCTIINCNFQHNGVGVWVHDSKDIRLMRNNVFDNQIGTFVTNSKVEIKENHVFDNDLWGILSDCNSSCRISMNTVFGNKTGGVCVNYRKRNDLPPCDVELNKIHDNGGPGFLDQTVEFVKMTELSFQFRTIYSAHIFSYNLLLKNTTSLPSAVRQDNVIFRNNERENVGRIKVTVPFCSNCRSQNQLDKCKGCRTASYCNKKCRKEHRSKHEKMCGVLRKMSSCVINSKGRAKNGTTELVEGPLEIGPTFSSSQNSKKCVVKVHTLPTQTNGLYDLVLYDRGLHLYELFHSNTVATQVKEFGMLCNRNIFEKKFFFFCVLEDNGEIRLFTNTFPKFQDW